MPPIAAPAVTLNASAVTAESEAVWRVAVNTAQLIMLATVVRVLQLETRGFYQLLLLAAAAYPVLALVRPAWRIPGFAIASVIGLFVALGPGQVAWLLVLGAGLIALCHVPVAWGWRLLLLGAAAGVLLLGRIGVVPIPLPEGLWPVLGSIFMFRLALYAYAVRHGDAPPGFWPAVAYFFMLPNVVFPLFPVVDYQTFARGSAGAPLWRVHERGLQWILRGILHLLLYRLVSNHLVVDPADVWTVSDLLRAVVSSYLLYLRVSGQFHLIVGLLHLFGFYLPETHHLFYLASGFTDLWRRINLYWTDFMKKLVYYPSFFRLRRHGQLRALLLSTVAVFVVTWALHGWQTFWLIGTPGFTVPDGLFWGLLAFLVLATTIYERDRPRQAAVARWGLRRAAAVTGTFIAMSALWSLWSAESVAEWTSMFTAVAPPTPAEWLTIAGLTAGFALIAGWPWGARRPTAGVPANPPLRAQLSAGALRLAGAGLLLAVTQPMVQQALPAAALPLARSLGERRFHPREEALLQRGYYEQLNAASRTGGHLWDVLAQRPRWWNAELRSTSAWRPRQDLLLAELAPNQAIRYKGQPFTTNEWGMRDDPVALARTPGTVRAALLGPSTVMGYGVGDADVLDRHLEVLFREGSPRRSVEVLNFGFEGHSLSQQLMMLEEKVRPFSPDVVFIAISPIEHRLAAGHFRRVLRDRLPIRYDSLAAMVATLGLDESATYEEILRALRPHDAWLQQWALTSLHDRIVAMGATPIALAMRMPTQPRGRIGATAAIARRVGFEVVDVSDVFVGADERSFQVAPWDQHPSAAGHRRLAEALYAKLLPLAPFADPSSFSEAP